MKKKNLFVLISAVVIIGAVTAAKTDILQKLLSSNDEEVTENVPQKIVPPNGQYYMAPKWSPDGNYVAFSSANYKGLWIKNLTTNKVSQLTDETAAGFGYEWSPDSKVILSKVAKYEEMKRYNAVKLFFVESKETKQLSNYKTFMPGLPHWTSLGKEVYLFDGKNLDVLETGIAFSTLNKNVASQKIVYSKNNKIYVGENTSQSYSAFEPLNSKEYVNLTSSPDGLKIAFEVYGGNLYLMNADGTGLIDLGKGNRPEWSADSKRIVYMIAEDDGENYTSSDIYTVKADGTGKTQLTKTDDILEMNPSISPDEKYIAYNDMNKGTINFLLVNLQ